MNKVIIVGRIASDLQVRTANSGKSVMRFSVAVDRKFKREGQPTADFFNVIAFGRQAEVIGQYMVKGSQIALQGRLQTGSYTDKNGNKRYTTDIMLDEFDFISSKQNNFEKQTNAVAEQFGVPVSELDDDFSLMAEDGDVPF